LEQLPGLYGLGALCPQLTSLAVNMNGLQHLQGLQACSGLVQLSAQVRGLGTVKWPVLALHLGELWSIRAPDVWLQGFPSAEVRVPVCACQAGRSLGMAVRQ
jgi:hypothetical protein